MQTNVQLDSNAAHHIKRDHLTIEVSVYFSVFVHSISVIHISGD